MSNENELDRISGTPPGTPPGTEQPNDTLARVQAEVDEGLYNSAYQVLAGLDEGKAQAIVDDPTNVENLGKQPWYGKIRGIFGSKGST